MSSWEKSEGAKIGIEFTEPITDMQEGIENAFTILGQEPLWVDYPSEDLGTLIDGDYQVDTVEIDEVDAKKILLTMKPLKRFHNIEGDITVNYDPIVAMLISNGSIVQAFSETFTPQDLERVPNPHRAETIAASITDYTLDLTRLYHMVVGPGPFPTDDPRSQKEAATGVEKGEWGANNSETISASITDYTLVLTHIDHIDP